MDSSEILNDHERRISHLEGKLDSLATKELVLQLNAELLKEMNIEFREINRKIDEQNERIDQQTSELREDLQRLDKRINVQDRKYTKLAGAAVAIGFILSILVGAANFYATAVSAGLLNTG